MRVLVACECSGIIRDAFAARGHDAWSCDLKPSERPGQHLQCDVRDVIGQAWDMLIAHPECRYLCNSGALRLYAGSKGVVRDEERWRNMVAAAEFFWALLNQEHIAKRVLENPVMHGHAARIIGRKQDQTIQPYDFGEDASKRTGLWLVGVSPLVPTKYVQPRIVNGKPRWANQTDGGFNRLGPSPTRPADRARTYQGIADAMAEQWG